MFLIIKTHGTGYRLLIPRNRVSTIIIIIIINIIIIIKDWAFLSLSISGLIKVFSPSLQWSASLSLLISG
jgi:hypothetical protein